MKKTLVLLLSVYILGPAVMHAQEYSLGQESVVSSPATQSVDASDEDGYSKYRFGGYGEILFQQMNYGENRFDSPAGSTSDKRSNISVPRAVFAFDYKFTRSISFHTELEFEYLGTGSAMEFDAKNEGGEYEYEFEKGGEVVLEQFYFNKRFARWMNLSVGHMVIPVGLTNAHHEPIFYFGTTRPESETMIIPSTWHETGVSLSGSLSDFSYQLMCVSGLDPNYISNDKWVAGASQGRYEVTKFTNPAFVWRLDYRGIPYTRIGFSGYYGETAKNSTRTAKMAGITTPVTILSGDAQFRSSHIQARANIIWGNLGNSKELSVLNTQFPKDKTFPRTVVAKNALSYGGEVGYDVGQFIKDDLKIYPFVRYDYYNSMQETEGNITSDPRYKCEAWTFGLNYYPTPQLVVKADYKNRRIDHGNFNDENTFGLAVGYTGWFFKK